MQNKTCAWNNKRSAAVSNCSYTLYKLPRVCMCITFQLMNIKFQHQARCVMWWKIKFKLAEREKRDCLSAGAIKSLFARSPPTLIYIARGARTKKILGCGRASERTIDAAAESLSHKKARLAAFYCSPLGNNFTMNCFALECGKSRDMRARTYLLSCKSHQHAPPDIIIVSCMLIRIRGRALFPPLIGGVRLMAH